MWAFADSFDLYAAATDPFAGYWDATSVQGGGTGPIIPGRWGVGGGNGWAMAGNAHLDKSSAVNDQVHHIVVSAQLTSFGANTASHYFTLYDGATAQCTVQLNQNGNIMLFTGGPSGVGTLAATYTAAISGTAWIGLEFEITIHNTLGAFNVRRNGASANEFSSGNVNTRGGTTNNYANAIKIGLPGPASFCNIDDFFWKSDASFVPWLGDLRCYTRMPVSVAQGQFTPSGTRAYSYAQAGGATAVVANEARYVPVTVGTNGAIASMTCNFPYGGATQHVKGALFADAAGSPGTLLGAATNIVQPTGGGVFTYNFSPPISVTAGQKIWFGQCVDLTSSGAQFFIMNSGTNGWQSTALAYASFPTSNPGSLTALGGPQASAIVTLDNAGCCNEPQQDANATYVFDSNVGDNDLYAIGSISPALPPILAVVSRCFMQKSDTGARTGGVQMKSGATLVNSPNVLLNNAAWTWAWRSDLTDPNTGAAWTPSAVNAIQLGPKVAA